MFDEATTKYMEIFWPGYFEKYAATAIAKQRFVHYTNASTAKSILENGELWLRNATVMNDFSEISYGIDLIYSSLGTEVGSRFRSIVKQLLPEDEVASLDALLDGWIPDWKNETYLACVSIHEDEEDEHGRLSMWRAYGDVALVINNTPMMVTTDKLGVFSVPVRYWSKTQFLSQLELITKNMENKAEYLAGMGPDAVSGYIYHTFQNIALGSKHPGFSEEKEWRIYYRPYENKSDIVKTRTVTINGIVQDIYILPLVNDPDQGLHGADIPNLLDRLIIGPTDFGAVTRNAFARILKTAGVENPHDRIIVSQIPLRTRN